MGAVEYHPDIPIEVMQDEFVALINFLREEVCVKHGKTIIHRTWDTWPNRFHANADFYQARHRSDRATREARFFD